MLSTCKWHQVGLLFFNFVNHVSSLTCVSHAIHPITHLVTPSKFRMAKISLKILPLLTHYNRYKLPTQRKWGQNGIHENKVWLGRSFESGFDTTCCCSCLLGLSFLKVADATIFITLSVCLLVENWNVLCTVLLLQMCPLPLPHSSFLRYYVNPISGLRFVWDSTLVYV